MANALSKSQLAAAIAEKAEISKKQAVEILDEHLLARVMGADDLDGDALGEIARAFLLGFIDNPHAALKDFADDFVAKLALNGEECHGRMV